MKKKRVSSAAAAIGWVVALCAADPVVARAAIATEEVWFETANGRLAGAVLEPTEGGARPGVVIVSGSGPNGRDGRIFGFPAYRLIAEHLARAGASVLIVDRRGVGGSEGDWRHETIPDRAEDALAALHFLRRRPGVDPEQVGLLGHSQGGWVAVEAAAAAPADVDFVVLMAGPAQSVYDQIIADETAQRRLAGAEAEEVARYGRRLRFWLGAIRAVAPACRPLRLHSLCFTIDYRPEAALGQVRAPVLALYGELDSLVPPDPNVRLLETSLPPETDLTVRVLPEANHQFWRASTGARAEYADLVRAYVPAFLETLSDWVLDRPQVPAGPDRSNPSGS